jgi:hypothetical protein
MSPNERRCMEEKNDLQEPHCVLETSHIEFCLACQGLVTSAMIRCTGDLKTLNRVYFHCVRDRLQKTYQSQTVKMTQQQNKKS